MYLAAGQCMGQRLLRSGLPGAGFLASRDKGLDVYRTELEVTSRVYRHLNDAAFRNIALTESLFRLLGLDHEMLSAYSN